MHNSTAAINTEQFPGSEGALRRGEEENSLGDFLHLSDASQRVGGLSLLQEGLVLLL